MKGLIVFSSWDSILPPSAFGLRNVWGPSDDELPPVSLFIYILTTSLGLVATLETQCKL